MSDEHSNNPEEMSEERREQLIEEASKTVGGLDRGADPRDEAMLREEEERLRKLLGGLSLPEESHPPAEEPPANED